MYFIAKYPYSSKTLSGVRNIDSIRWFIWQAENKLALSCSSGI